MRADTSELDCPRVVDVRHLGGHVLWLRFSDGVEGEADLAGWLNGPVFEPLRDVQRFAEVRLDPPLTISWPNEAVECAILGGLVIPSSRSPARTARGAEYSPPA